MKLFFISILSLFLIQDTVLSQTLEEDVTTIKIDKYLSELENRGFYGAVLVELHGKPVISKGYGFSDIENQINNSQTTIFDIGSITKQFTAAAILKLEMQGKLSTEDKISKFFENIPRDKEAISIHDLLRHQAGLISNIGKDYEEITEAEFLNKVFSSELKFTTGSNFSYSNIGYSLLTLIIEVVSNQTYEDYLYENLWKPAFMESTGYTRPDFNPNHIAVGYSGNDQVWGKPTDKEWDTTSPYLHLKGNGGILSTTEDLYKWHRSLLTQNILSVNAKQKMFYPNLRPEETRNSFYAYGWDVSQTGRNTAQVWHNGANGIFYADFLGFPDEEVVIIMLSNRSHPNFDKLSFDLSRMIFNPDFTPNIPAADNEANRNFTAHILKTIKVNDLEKAKFEFDRKNSEQLLEFVMRNEAFNQLDKRQPEIAISIFEMNVFAHPGSAKALQDLGEGYMETGKKDLALKYFKESLHLNPDNPFVNQMINRLQE